MFPQLSHALISILLLAPLIGFLFNGLRYRSQNYKLAGGIASGAVAISFVSSLLLWVQLLGMPEGERQITAHFFNWISLADFQAPATFVVDPISLIMLLVITGVGLLIHIFSIGYMSHDDRPAKYFSYLNLFLFNMLLLVLGNNLLVMFVGWEGVGLCSYLLIGFWFTDSEKAAAGMKAFITNRIGDAGFLLGIFMLFMTFGTIEFAELSSSLPSLPESGWGGPITLACLLLFIGATGKSAQIPLYVWLPDAMAGPTPVSALIHAATMVTAGVYMIIRMSDVFLMAPNAMMVIATTGAITAFVAASIAMTQWDIKKVLAYSTISQLGYMFLGVGVGAFMPALFHLMTHAFFKALMFLGAGSVIHAMNNEQDIRKMGGLRKLMPITYITFTMGWLAIIGIPPFAGFFSKDEILWYSFASPQGGNFFLWFIGIVTAGMTAFYMTRLMALTFWGSSRVPKNIRPHESPITMTFPLVVLGILSVIGGWVGIPHVIAEIIPWHPPNNLEHWLEPVLKSVTADLPKNLEWGLMGISVSLAVAGAAFAYRCYIEKPELPKRIARKWGGCYEAVYNKYWVDEIYFNKIVNPLVNMSKGLWLYIDVNLIDKTTYILSDFIRSCGGGLRSLQNGNMQQYALYIVLGLIGVMTIILMG